MAIIVMIRTYKGVKTLAAKLSKMGKE